MHMSRLLSAAAGAALLSGCATVPDLGPRPETRAASSFAATQSLASDSAAAWPGDRWWADYGDAQLAGLIEEGLRGAPDLAAADARLRSARAYAEQAGAARLPSVGVEASALETKQSYNNGIPADFVPKGWNDTGHVAATLNFDLDLWGRNRASLRAATSDAEAARIELEQARLVLSTNIASAYADLARYARERAVQAEALDIRTRTQRLVTDRVTSGLDTQAEQKQAEAGVPSARADLAATDEAIGLTRNRIAALLGQGPDRGLSIALPTAPVIARGLPAGVTTDLIGRRPDIAASRARVEAAAARIKVARADFYPAVNLSALIGFQALGLNKLFDGGSTYGQVGPAVSLPIFRGGQLTGQYRGARAAFDEAVANYDGTVATAYREVADAVTSQRALATRLAETRQALASSEQAYNVARLRYEGGLSTFLDVLTAEERVLQVRQAAAELEARAFTLDVQLVRALGGGFSTTSAAAAATKDQTHG
ncbi:efflux transporter outer membrane subunit [Sphingomonas sp. S2-65]|uniref:efflux transporter outer membrane subunit n=1 Tax=Sphingomonas sp. S2-65 TaxID=2903960 RepID=UPI001F4061B9|nr:efflux transporter outer membrane subunit [Sphingomonas sp. S2-65]UYY59199.1 efflux transporter outer membrane subunit [Sphingomonas sp. S2-65]